MGDRANVKIIHSNGIPIYLYTHWGGCELAADVRAALRLEERWDDENYLTRIIFCKMLGNDPSVWHGTTSFGIGLAVTDNEHPIIEINIKEQTIAFTDEAYQPGYDLDAEKTKEFAKWTFDEFIKLPKDEITNAYHLAER